MRRALWLAFNLSTVAFAAEKFEVFSLRSPVLIFNQTQTETVTRGRQLVNHDRVTIGKNGGITIDSSEDSTISVIGPAEFEFEMVEHSPVLRVVYGDFYFKGSANTVLDVVVSDEWVPLYANEFFVEVNSQSQNIKLRNIGEDLKVFGLRLQHAEMLFRNPNRTWVTPLPKLEQEDFQRRHLNNRLLYSLNDKNETFEPKLGSDGLRNSAEIGFVLGLSKLSPEANSTFLQNLSGLGAFFKIGTKSFFDLPEKPVRGNYLYGTTFRVGLSTQFLAAWVKPKEATAGRTTLAILAPYLGVSWHGAILDTLVGYQKLTAPDYKAKYAFSLGADLGYRIDFHEEGKSKSSEDFGIILLVRYLYTPMEPKTAAAVSDVIPQEFTWHFFSCAAGLSFLF